MPSPNECSYHADKDLCCVSEILAAKADVCDAYREWLAYPV